MSNDKKEFVKIAAIVCVLSSITTIGIHAFFEFNVTTFEERLTLFQNTTYLVNRWWVIAHCLFVIVSMWGFFLVQYKRSLGFAGLGFVFFVVFGIAEISRQMLVLFYVNGMRRQYLATDNEATRAFLAESLNNFGLLSYPLFGLFIVAFAFGNLFYGLSLIREGGFSYVLGILLLLWSVCNFMAFANEFWEVSWISAFLQPYSVWYQPAMRILMGVWLWKAASKESEPL